MTHDDETVERVARAVFDTLVSQTTGRAPKHDYDDTLEDNREAARELARAALSAMPQRELLREALSALDFYANKDNHKMRREPSYRDRFSQNMKPGRPKLGRVSEDKGKRARAAADKIRAALEHQQKGEGL